ncbi:MAG: FtsL-like putative cell division protein [Salibacteraceae bacterium]
MGNQEAKSGKAKSRKGRKVARPFIDLLSGNLLTREDVVQHLPYFLFLSFLCLVYIGNGFIAEGTVRKLNRNGQQIKELRSEYITIKSDLMVRSKQSELARLIQEKNLGLKESFAPPKKIVVEEGTLASEDGK